MGYGYPTCGQTEGQTRVKTLPSLVLRTRAVKIYMQTELNKGSSGWCHETSDDIWTDFRTKARRQLVLNWVVNWIRLFFVQYSCNWLFVDAVYLPSASEGWGRYCFHRCMSAQRGEGVSPSRLVPGLWSQGPFLDEGRGYSLIYGPRLSLGGGNPVRS